MVGDTNWKETFHLSRLRRPVRNWESHVDFRCRAAFRRHEGGSGGASALRRLVILASPPDKHRAKQQASVSEEDKLQLEGPR